MKQHVMLVDDHDLLRRGLRDLLRSEFGVETFIEASSAGEAAQALAEMQPGIVIVDLNLGDGSGIDLCRTVRNRWPDARVLVFTASEDPTAIASAFDAGANGYVLKGAPHAELIGAVARVLEGHDSFAPSTARIVVAEARARRTAEDALHRLSRSERIVYRLIREGIAVEEIAARLHLSTKTVRNVLASARSKLRGEATA